MKKAGRRPAFGAYNSLGGPLSRKSGSPVLAVAAVVIIVVVVVIPVEAQYPGVVHDLAGDDGEDRADLPHVRVAHPEVIAVEHHEIGVYENLIMNAEAMGRPDVASLLAKNLEVEQHTLDEVKRMQREVVAAAPSRAA